MAHDLFRLIAFGHVALDRDVVGNTALVIGDWHNAKLHVELTPIFPIIGHFHFHRFLCLEVFAHLIQHGPVCLWTLEYPGGLF